MRKNQLNKKLIIIKIIVIMALLLNIFKIELHAKSGNAYNFEETYITRVIPKTTVSDFISNLNTDEDVTVMNSNQESVEQEDIIKTGMIVKIGEKNYTLSVIGDVNSDGDLTVDDIKIGENQLIGLENLEEIYIKSLDINDDEKYTITDLVQLNLIASNEKKIEDYIDNSIEEELLFGMPEKTYEPDGDEDKDGLTNAEEEALGTKVYSADTDQDGLTDYYEVNVSKTDPLKADTDGDGINDGDEVELALDPLKQDSKGDGIIDGERTLTHNIKDDEIGVNIEITGKGNIASTTIDAINASVVEEGALDKIYNFNTTGNMDNAVVKIKYDIDEVNKKGLNEDKLSVYYLNLNDNQLEKIETTIDKENKELTANLNHFSPYVVADFDGAKNKEISYKEKLEAAGWVDFDNNGTLDGYKRIDSGFIPNRDGFSFENFSSYQSTGGNCAGMARFAMLYYMNQLPIELSELYVPSETAKYVPKEGWNSNGYDLSDTYFENGGNLYDYKISDEGLKILLGEKPSDYYSGVIDDTLQIREKYRNKFNQIGAILNIGELINKKSYSKIQYALLNVDNEKFNNNVKKDESQMLNAIWRLFINQAIDNEDHISNNYPILLKAYENLNSDECFKKLEQSLNNKIPVIFNFEIPEVGGHATNAIHIIDDMNDFNKFKIGIYDNNYQGEIRYVECTRHKNNLLIGSWRESVYWYSFEYDWNNDGKIDKLENVSITVPEKEESDAIYVKLYDDGTLAFTATDRVLEGKTVVKSYGDIYGKEFGYYTKAPWCYERKDIKNVNIIDKISPKSTAYWFYYLYELTEIKNISNLDTSKVTDMHYMFGDCRSLTSLDLSSFDTSKVTDMSHMFCFCNGLTSLDLSSFDTSNVTDMEYMFGCCESLTSLDVSNFDTSKVTDMGGMFYNCSALTSLDVSNFNTSEVTKMSDMFSECYSLTSLNVSSFNTSNVTDMSDMFDNCKLLTRLDFSSLDTRNVTNMAGMFDRCMSLTSLDLSSFDTSKVTDMSDIFTSCFSLKNLDLSSFDTSKVTDMSDMFYNCEGLTSLNLSSFDTSNVTAMGGMFEECNALTSLDLSSFNTSKVTDMSDMFYDCEGLTSLNVSSFNTSNVTNMGNMFFNCESLTSLDLSSFDTSNVEDTRFMFSFCYKLKFIYIGNGWTCVKDERMQMK